MSAQFPAAITRLIDAFSRLPGIGEKSAQRLVFHLIRSPDRASTELGEAASRLKSDLQFCTVCRNVTDTVTCTICADDRRDHTQICVVEEALDVIALERSGSYRGVYHVLHGVLNPLDGVGPDELTVKDLMRRVADMTPTEFILAMNPSTEGEATAAYLARQLKSSGARISRLARGLPTGTELTYADDITLSAALSGRRDM